jgi:hypothetical protein
VFLTRFITRSRALAAALSALGLAPPAGADWKYRRARSTDSDLALQSHTHEWLRSMPRRLYPTQLCRHYPRLANRIALCWHDAEQLDVMLSDLLQDRRGHRRGFGPRINAEIQRLQRHNSGRLHPLRRVREALDARTAAADLQRRIDPGLTLAAPPLKK